MIPLYFPFTAISDEKLNKMTAAFGSISVFSLLPDRNDMRTGLKKVFPVTGENERLSRLLVEFRDFIAFNRDKVSDFLTGRSKVPFFDPDWTSEIRSEVIKGLDETRTARKSALDEKDRLLQAMAFLEIAKDYDETTLNIDCEFDAIERREKMLLNELKGEADLGDFTFEDEDPDKLHEKDDGFRIGTRLSAWSALFCHAWPDRGITGDGFFLTDHFGVIDWFDACGKELIPVDIPSFIPTDLSVFEKGMNQLLTHDYQAVFPHIKRIFGPVPFNEGTAGLRLWISPGRAPGDFFSTLWKGAPHENQGETGIRNTVIGLFKS